MNNTIDIYINNDINYIVVTIVVVETYNQVVIADKFMLSFYNYNLPIFVF